MDKLIKIAPLFMPISLGAVFPLCFIFVLGIPGVDDGSNFSKGIGIVLPTLLLYIFVDFVLLVILGISHFISKRMEKQNHIGTGVIYIFWIYFLGSTLSFLYGLSLLFL